MTNIVELESRLIRPIALFLTFLMFSPLGQASPIVNGSFETGDYSGWTLTRSTPFNQQGYSQAIEQTGFVWGGPRLPLYDQFTQSIHTPPCNCGPQSQVLEASDGDRFVYWNMSTSPVGGGTGVMSMSQAVNLDGSSAVLQWDQGIRALTSGGNNAFSVSFRSLDGTLLRTLFTTRTVGPYVGQPTITPMPTLRTMSADISEFAGRQVVLSVDLALGFDQIDLVLDNFRVVAAPTGQLPEPSTAALVGLVLGIAALCRWRTWGAGQRRR